MFEKDIQEFIWKASFEDLYEITKVKEENNKEQS